MSEDMLYGIGCMMMGAGMLINWWFEMFSDSGYADLCRSMMKSSFNLGRNTIALIEPAVGGAMFCAGLLLLSEKDSHLESITRPLCFFFLIVIAFGLIPFRLPKQMYPEWQMEKRRQRAVQAREEENAIDEASPSVLQASIPRDFSTPGDSFPPRTLQQNNYPQVRNGHRAENDFRRREL